jgi:predicted alpha/beta-hydrolase family hydrolase
MSELGALIAIEEQAVPEFLVDGPEAASITMALAHGAGAPMDSPFLTFFAKGLAAQGHRVVRFEFPYMAAHRRDGNRRPPDRPNVLLDTWQSVIDRLGAERLVIGGKSLGGRMASMIADAAGVQGLVCLGYPFHPPGQPEKLRIAHLRSLGTRALILQGSRDPFGTREEVVRLPLSPAIRFHFLEDGDHGFAPRAASGRTERQNWQQALDELARFLAQV